MQHMCCCFVGGTLLAAANRAVGGRVQNGRAPFSPIGSTVFLTLHALAPRTRHSTDTLPNETSALGLHLSKALERKKAQDRYAEELPLLAREVERAVDEARRQVA
jgi:hypothetical protein